MALPSGYKRLEYIKSNGNQYIDSGVVPGSSDFSVKSKISTTAATSAENWFVTIGHSKPSGTATYAQFGTWNSKFAIHLTYVAIDGGTSATSDAVTIDFSVSGNTASLSGDATYSITNANYESGTYRNQNITICDGLWRTYWTQIIVGGVLVRDYIPCIKDDGTIGLWDDVNSVFYGNAGTGVFTAGPVVAIAEDFSGITELEYIQSSGTQYVDTGFKPNQNTEIQLDVAFLGSVGSNIAGVRNSSSDATNRFGIITFGSASKIGAFFRDSAIQAISFDANRHSYKLKKSGLELDGTSYGSANIGTFACTYSIVLFGWNNGSDGIDTTISRVYACKIYDNGVLARDYIAAKLSNGTIGLYDKLNGLLYINAGTGTFTAGPELTIKTPTNFKLSTSTEYTATLSWDAVSDASGYKLYRDGVLIATLTGNSYTDTIQPFVSYVYSLTAYNDDRESDPATISVKVIVPPAAPSAFNVSGVTMQTTALSWAEVTGADNYQLKRDGAVIYSGTAATFMDTGLTPGTSYTYALTAVNTAGSSAALSISINTLSILDLVTDRTAADVEAKNEKGTYNAIDLNRVGEAMQYVADRLKALGYVVGISPKADWKETDYPNTSAMMQYLEDLAELRSKFSQASTTPNVPLDMEGLTYKEANDIERILIHIDDSVSRLLSTLFYAAEIYSGEG